MEINPNNGLAWNSKGWVLDNLGRFSEALAAIERALEINPSYDMAWNNKGWVLGKLGRFSEALAAYERALEIKPSYGLALSNKGEVLCKLGRPTEAVPTLDRAIELDPKNANAWLWRAITKVELGLDQEAAEDYLKATELQVDVPRAYREFAEARLLQGDWVKAERVLEQGAERATAMEKERADSTFLSTLIESLFQSTADRKVWSRRVRRVVELAIEDRSGESTTTLPYPRLRRYLFGARHREDGDKAPSTTDPLTILGDALVRSLTKPSYIEVPAELLQSWAEVWKEVAAEHQDLSLAVRIFEVGVRYLTTKKERVLFDLLQEERAILRDLFELGEQGSERER